MSEKMNEEEMANYFKTADWQTRTNLRTDDRLMSIAHFRAGDMCDRSYFSHQDPDGYWPNKNVRLAGYELPDFYQDDSNQVESIAVGFETYQDAFAALVASPEHTSHMRGLSFWEGHTFFGVGMRVDRGCRLYVVITAPPEEEGEENDYTVHLPVISRGVKA